MKILQPDGALAYQVRPQSGRPADPIAEILKNTKTIAVVGLSSNAMRPSHGVAEYLQAAGYRIVPVNPNETNVLGEKSYPRLEDVPLKIDLVDIFRRAGVVPPVVGGAIRAGAKEGWVEMGVFHEEAAGKARRGGMTVVIDACILMGRKKKATRDF